MKGSTYATSPSSINAFSTVRRNPSGSFYALEPIKGSKTKRTLLTPDALPRFRAVVPGDVEAGVLGRGAGAGGAAGAGALRPVADAQVRAVDGGGGAWGRGSGKVEDLIGLAGMDRYG